MKLISFHVSTCKGSAILLNPLINFQKKYTKPKNNCTCCMVVGFGHSLRLLTLASLICSPSGMMSNPRKVVVHCRKLHYYHYFVQHVHEQIIHCSHEHCWHIRQPHGHHNPFVKPVPYQKCCLWYFFLCYTALPVSATKIQ